MASPARGEGLRLYLWATTACLKYSIVSFLYFTAADHDVTLSYSPFDLLQDLALVLVGLLVGLERVREHSVPEDHVQGTDSRIVGFYLC